LLERVDGFPKNQRFIFGQRIADQCLAVRNGRLTFDLWEANRSQLVQTGVQPACIELAGICTICDHRFWSHRRDGHNAGRNAMFVALRG